MGTDHIRNTDGSETATRNSESPTDGRGYANKAIFAAAIGYGLDGFDLMILSFALPGIMATMHLTPPTAGWLATVTLFGAVVGGVVFGVLSDRFGRVRVLAYSIILFALFSGLSAVAQGFWDLAAYRFMAGIGIGGEFGIGMTLTAEAVAAKRRARATSWVNVGFNTGVLAAALVSIPVISEFGWRGIFVVGIFPAFVAFILRKRLHEPAKFLSSVRPKRPSLFTTMRVLLTHHRGPVTFFALVTLTSVQNFGFYGLMTWLPHYLESRFGLDLTSSSVWTAATVLGMTVGTIAFGYIADYAGRRPAFWIFQIGAACSVLTYSQLSSPLSLLIGGFIMGIFASGMIGGYGALIAEIYYTEVRAAAINIIFNIGRGIGGLAPVLISLVAFHTGFGFALSILPLIYLLAFGAMFVLPDRKGVELS